MFISLRNRLRQHPLFRTLFDLRGNPKACVLTEPLWNIPHSLYAPFFTVYMYALGIDDKQIGLLISIGMVMQAMTILIGGVLNDKLGRRKTTLIFDILSWSVPVFLWSLAGSYTLFVAAAIFNGLWQITANSWNCLLVEDAVEQDLVNIYTWVTVTGLLSVFLAPLTAFMVSSHGLIPTMRKLLFITFLMMTAKFVILYFTTTETKQGTKRMAETKGVSIRKLMRGYREVLGLLLANKRMLLLLSILTIHNITSTISSNFFSLLATQDLGITESWLAYYPMVRAAIMLVFIFTIQHVVNRMNFKVPLTLGLILYGISQILLIVSPKDMPLYLMVYIMLDAFAAALFVPQKDALTATFVEPEERSRLISLIYIIMIAVSTPFGWIAGSLSDWNRRTPFVLNTALYLCCLVLVIVSLRRKSTDSKP